MTTVYILQEVQPFLGSTGCSRCAILISCILHLSGLWARVARMKSFLMKKHPSSAKLSHNRVENVLQFEETKIEDFGHHSKKYIWRAHTQTHQQKNSVSTVKHDGSRILFWHWNWGFIKREGNHEQLGVPVSFGSEPAGVHQKAEDLHLSV